MVNPWLAGGAIGLSALGGLSSSRKAKHRYQGMVDLINRGSAISSELLRQGFSQARGHEEQALERIQQGHEGAKREASRVGREHRRGVLERGKALEGSLSSGMVSSGLSSTTVADNAKRGIAADTTRQMLAIDSELANLYAQLEQQGAASEAVALGSLSTLDRSEARAQEDVNRWKWSSFAQTPTPPSNSFDFSGLANLLELF